MGAHVFVRYDRRQTECAVIILEDTDDPLEHPPSSADETPFEYAAKTACPPEVEELLAITALRLPMYLGLADVYGPVRSALICGWNEGARRHGLSVTAEEFSTAFKYCAPWQMHGVFRAMLVDRFLWVLTLKEHYADNSPLDWDTVELVLAASFQLGYVLGDGGVM